jgi:O-antigen/teichoic acid export membrane protein
MDHRGLASSASDKRVSHWAAVGRRLTLSLPSRLAPFGRTLGTTGGLVVAIILNSATGFIFWWIAARTFPADAVGLAAAAVSAMLLLSQIAVLGLGTQLAGVLHREPRTASLAITALVAAGSAGALLGLGFSLAAPALSQELSPLAAGPLTVLVFVAGVSLTTLASVLDQVLVSLFYNAYQLLRNAVFSFGRLALLAAAAVLLAPAGMVIYGVWASGVLLSLATVLVLIHRARLSTNVRPLMWRTLSEMTRSAFTHHVLDLSRSSSVWLLPLLVTVVLSPEQNASFYVAMLLANFIAIVGKSGTFTLYIVGARAPDELWRHLRVTLALAIGISLVGTVALTFAGRTLLGLFGHAYTSAFPTVAVLGLSCLPLAVKDHWIAIQRVRGTVGTAAVIGVGLLLLELFASAIGAATDGLVGLAIARLAVLTLQAAFMTPIVYRSLFPGTLGTSALPTDESARGDFQG